MTKRWNTYKIAGWGLVFGGLYSAIKYTLEDGLPRGAEGIVYIISYLGGGAIGGALLFAVVSGVRNLILRAK